jgi:hypothetical protein
VSSLRPAFACTVASLLVTAGCGRTTPVEVIDDFGQCRQNAGEFANAGCADVVGNVVGARSQPLPAVDVGLRQAAAAGQLAAPCVQTDARGQFHLRLTRMAPPGLPDTASVWVGATVRPTLPQLAATTRDSVLVVVSVAPIGCVPVAAHVTIALPVP